jgi:uncharacterized protein|tara:strand:+ start:358 stop:1383 length:1026 start_codon:yes stop_codon:yes gene_type:complete
MDYKGSKDMSLEVAEKLIKSFLNYNSDYAHFTWIGGEPLILKNSFFEQITKFCSKHNKKNLKISNSIQTNGLTLNAEKKNYLSNLGFKIGISYDGCNDLQESQRGTKNDKSVGLKILKNFENAGKNLGTISVLTKNSVGMEKEIYENLRSLTNSARLNLYAPSGEGLEKISELLPSKDEAKEMLLKFYDLWKKDDLNFQLDPFREMVKSFFTGVPKTCEFSAFSCYRILGADTDGKLYTCSRSTHLPETFLGDINKDSLERIIGSTKHSKILDRYMKLKKEGCKWFSLCSGGCPIEAMSHTGNFMNSTYYCCDVKGTIFEKIEEDLNNGFKEYLAEKVKFI